MDSFRWVLLLVGAAVFLLIYLFSRRKSRDDNLGRNNHVSAEVLADSEVPSILIQDDSEPALDILAKNMHITDEKNMPGNTEVPVGKLEEERLIIFYLVEKNGGYLSGLSIVDALEKAGLRYGDMKIYHFHTEDMSQDLPSIFSVANIIDPGYFDLVTMNQVSTPGLAIFMNLPGPVKSVHAYDLMFSVIEELKQLLPIVVKNKKQEVVSKQNLMHLREELVEQQRKRTLAEKTV